MSDTEDPQAVNGSEGPDPQSFPTPADVAAQAAAELREEEKPDAEKAPRTTEQLEAELAKVRREAANYRTKLREAEPLVKAARDAEEANKSEVQKAQERSQQLERDYAELQTQTWQLELAGQYGVPHEDRDLIGSGSREEMEARATRLGARFATNEKTPPPPSNRPVEGLRPGATPDPPKPADTSYPSDWDRRPARQT